MFSKIENAIQEIKAGRMIVVVDDEDRENEGDLVMAMEYATPESINFMATHGRGLICAPMITEDVERLKLNPMVSNNTDPKATGFTVSVDISTAKTGISAHERAETLLALMKAESKAEDFTRPGHIFPLHAKDGGVLKRAGHTEAAVDLSRLAGLKPAGVICEIMNDDGTMARVTDLIKYCKKHELIMITIKDLIAYRKQNETHIKRVSTAEMPTKYGDFTMVGFEDVLNGKHHVALIKGDISPNEEVLVRVHSECLTGDAFGSLRCDCGEQLALALQKIEKEGKGVLLYMKQEGRGIGLLNKIKAYKLQDNGMDTVEANLALGFDNDLRDYTIGAQILYDLGVRDIRLMTNNPLKISGIEDYGLRVVERVPIVMEYNEKNYYYLKTKQEKMNHMFELEVI
jgi:3,4-dihydroxy 2-butanone 4-phosphate synthase/GTP cyclohydrolase II